MSENPTKNRIIQVSTGRLVDPFDMKLEDIDILDIARGLAQQTRWGGHSEEGVSVAQHSCQVSYLVYDKDALTALMHDATEAYILDIPRPIKPFLEGYKEVEHNLMSVIAKKYNLEYPFNDAVHHADQLALECEYENLVNVYTGGYRCYHPDYAELLFLERFDILTGEKNVKRGFNNCVEYVINLPSSMNDHDAHYWLIGQLSAIVANVKDFHRWERAVAREMIVDIEQAYNYRKDYKEGEEFAFSSQNCLEMGRIFNTVRDRYEGHEVIYFKLIKTIG